MKFTCQRQELLQVLQIVSRAAGAKTQLPILDNVLLTAQSGRLQVSAHNMETAITTSCDANISNEGATTLPARTLLQWVGLATGEEVQFSKNENEEMTLKSGNATTKLKGMSASDYPPTPAIEKQDSAELSQVDFKKALEKVIFAASAESTRPTLSGVFFATNNEQLTLVTSDSYRLAEQKTTLTAVPTEQVSCIVPAKTLHELTRILSGDKESLQIIFSQSQILFRFNGIEFLSRLIDGQFPPYEQALAQEWQTKVTINRQELMQTIKRIDIFARVNNNNVKFFLEGNNLRVTTDATEFGSEESELSVQNSASVDLQTALNSTYLLDVLLVSKGEQITLNLGERLQPILVTVPDDKDFRYLIMPLKV